MGVSARLARRDELVETEIVKMIDPDQYRRIRQEEVDARALAAQIAGQFRQGGVQ